jgi:uncharacterized membrane protein YebE (DUF533 family)
MKTSLMKSTLGAVALAVGLGLFTTSVQADWGQQQRAHSDHGNRYDQQSRHFQQQVHARQDRQMDRIQAGMRSGKLTRMEFRELMHEQHNIRAMERYFRADGFINAREFHRLDQALNRASRNIHEERHDRQVRYASGHTPRFN